MGHPFSTELLSTPLFSPLCSYEGRSYEGHPAGYPEGGASDHMTGYGRLAL